MLKIIIADDHQVIREGIKRIINNESDLQVTGEVSSGEKLIAEVYENDYDIVILDIGLPGKSGLEILKDLRAAKPKLPVLVFSMQPEERMAIRAIKAGANSYLNKEVETSELLKALRTISTGRKYITPSIAERLAFMVEDDYSNLLPHQKLSEREYEVLILLAKGKSVKEIAESKSLSINTVNTYRNRILHKMDLMNNIEIAHYVIKNKLID